MKMPLRLPSVFGLSAIAGLTVILCLQGSLRLSSFEEKTHADLPRAISTATPDKLAADSIVAVNLSTDWTRRWAESNSIADDPSRKQERDALIEELAVTDPLRALKLAQDETNAESRLTLLQAAMRGWGAADPKAALAWADSQNLMDPGQARASVFHGAARDPENALRLAEQLSFQYPDRAGDYGNYLVAGLTRAGEFALATQFAAQSPWGIRADRLGAAYGAWAATDPQAALQNAGQLTDPEMFGTAFNIVVSTWANKDPQAVAHYSLGMTDEHQRSVVLSVALPVWVATDAHAAATWLSGLPSSPELDTGIACVALQLAAQRQPELALQWAETVVNPQLRVRALASVLNKWAVSNPLAALHYVEDASSPLHGEERFGVLVAFENNFEPLSLLP
jgi:hypothetical protein